MRARVVLVALLFATPAFAQEKFVSSDASVRTILEFKVSAASIQKLLPDGWEINSPTSGPATGSNLRITFIEGDSTDPALAMKLRDQITCPLLVVLDSDHAEAHVRKELELYAPMCRPGDRLVVEDTNVAWPHDRGARGALEDYLSVHHDEWRQDLLCERWLLSMHPGGWLVREKPCDGHR